MDCNNAYWVRMRRLPKTMGYARVRSLACVAWLYSDLLTQPRTLLGGTPPSCVFLYYDKHAWSFKSSLRGKVAEINQLCEKSARRAASRQRRAWSRCSWRTISELREAARGQNTSVGAGGLRLFSQALCRLHKDVRLTLWYCVILKHYSGVVQTFPSVTCSRVWSPFTSTAGTRPKAGKTTGFLDLRLAREELCACIAVYVERGRRPDTTSADLDGGTVLDHEWGRIPSAAYTRRHGPPVRAR